MCHDELPPPKKKILVRSFEKNQKKQWYLLGKSFGGGDASVMNKHYYYSLLIYMSCVYHLQNNFLHHHPTCTSLSFDIHWQTTAPQVPGSVGLSKLILNVIIQLSQNAHSQNPNHQKIQHPLTQEAQASRLQHSPAPPPSSNSVHKNTQPLLYFTLTMSPHDPGIPAHSHSPFLDSSDHSLAKSPIHKHMHTPGTHTSLFIWKNTRKHTQI